MGVVKFPLTHWIKSEAMDTAACGEDDHGGTAIEGITGSDHLSSGLEKVSLTGGSLADLRMGRHVKG